MPDLSEFATLLHPEDSVAVTRRLLPQGLELTGPTGTFRSLEAIPPGHKVAVRSISQNSDILKYGQFIGIAAKDIPAGSHVHSHNVQASMSHSRKQSPSPSSSKTFSQQSHAALPQFQGYARASGRVGTRNYIAVISSVNCSASVSRYIAEHFRRESLSTDYPSIDGVIALTHKTGCAIDPGEPNQVLQRVLAGMAQHPNIGGYLLVGLGCEVNQISSLVSQRQLKSSDPDSGAPICFNIQQVGGVRKTVEAGIQAVSRLLPQVARCQRTSQPASRLVLALNCGGSDGHSGCTANPALGYASDRLVACGGTSVLAETPEIYGAEHLLTARATTPEVAEKLMRRIRWWEEHVKTHGTSIDNNPSFGNRQGGLTTLFEKSLGAVAKGGRAPLKAVYEYAELVSESGFCFMDTPGYDPVSMTGLVAGGCNIAVFTTGRGSAYGCKPTPCIKVASNSALYRHQMDDMDLNAGTILDGTGSVESVGEEIFEKILEIASGQQTKSEACGLGDEEFAPWMLGPTL